MKTLSPTPLPKNLTARVSPLQPQDEAWMRQALTLANHGQGRTSPNPAVGCVAVRDGQLLGHGCHRKVGGPHGEIEALLDAKRRGNDFRGATLYVTLEPCSHHGRTPPCTDMCLREGVARVVVATLDPNPEVAGRGLRNLLEGGVEVSFGVLEREAWRSHLAFITRMTWGRPHITAKVAMSLDGRIATRTGASFPLTGEAARQRVHLLRDRLDAILVGRGTVEVDDPRLTCRLPEGLGGEGGARDPLRVVLDPKLRAPLASKIFHLQAEGISRAATVVLASEDEAREGRFQERAARLASLGVEVIEVPCLASGGLVLPEAMAALARRGVASLLVEGGGHTLGSFFEADLIDVWIAHIAPVLIGGRGATSPLEGRGVASLEDLHRLQVRRSHKVGDDLEVQAVARGDVYGLD